MTAQPIRVGLIGVGAVGQRLVKGLPANPDFRITYVCDTNEELAARTSAELGGIPWSADYRPMLARDQVDLVYIGVPPRWHKQIALDVIAAGKHILCEKPLALTLPDARVMTEAIQGTGLVHALHMGIHYAPGIRVLREKIAEGYLGELRQGEISMVFPRWPRDWQQNPWIGKREQGGAIREVGPHLFHVLMQIFGPVEAVHAQMQYPPNDAEACELAASGRLKLAGGQIVTVKLITNVPRPETVEMNFYGTKGTLGLRQWANPVGTQSAEEEPKPLEFPEPKGPALFGSIANAVRGEQADLPQFEHGLAIQEVLDAWERSAESGAWVTIER